MTGLGGDAANEGLWRRSCRQALKGGVAVAGGGRSLSYSTRRRLLSKRDVQAMLKSGVRSSLFVVSSAHDLYMWVKRIKRATAIENEVREEREVSMDGGTGPWHGNGGRRQGWRGG